MDITSPLYLAHQNERKAEKLLKNKKFEEAIQCHLNAKQCLEEAMGMTKVKKSLESLKLQRDFHQRQTDIVKVKKVQFEIQRQMKAYKNLKRLEKADAVVMVDPKEVQEDIQLAIFSGNGCGLRTMEEADSLLGLLTARGGCDESWKLPKDEATVMEELRTVNWQLRGLVEQLVTQLEVSRGEADALKARIDLETPQYDFNL